LPDPSLFLAQRVRIDILYEQQLPIHFLEIEALGGVSPEPVAPLTRLPG
jgi:hypothetical protein